MSAAGLSLFAYLHPYLFLTVGYDAVSARIHNH